jgi:hypothetical protein
MRIAKTTLIVSVVILLLFTTAYIIIMTQNITVSSPIGLFNWNPPEKENYIPIILSYPDSSVMAIGGPINDTRMSICTIKFLLKFNGTLSENTPIEIVNASCLSYVSYGIAASVSLPQAINYDYQSWIGNNDSLVVGWAGTEILGFEDERPHYDDSIYFEPISLIRQEIFYFPVAGDFSPMVRVYKIGQVLEGEVHTYESVKIHVISQPEIDQTRINKINLGLTVVLFGFSYIGGFALIYELIKKENEEKEICQFPIIIKIMPETKTPSPKTKEKTNTNLLKVQSDNVEVGEPKSDNKENKISTRPSNDNDSPN